MFRLLGVIIRSSSELIQNYLIPSALWDPVALTIVGAIVLWVHLCYCSVEGFRLPTSTQIATLDSILQGLHLCPNGKELCDGNKHHPKAIQPLLWQQHAATEMKPRRRLPPNTIPGKTSNGAGFS